MRVLTIWVIIGFVLQTAACQQDGDAEQRGQTSESLIINTQLPRPAEDPLLAIANQVPAFAGYYCTAGDLVIGLVSSVTASDTAQVVSLVDKAGVSFYCRNRDYPNHDPQ